MSDARRRMLCRIAVLALCAMPTVVVVNWILFPRSIDQWENDLRLVLGCPVAIGRVDTPAPNQLNFGGIQLIDAEKQTWAEFESVIWRQNLETQQVELSDAELSLNQFTTLIRHFLRQVPQFDLAKPIEIHLHRLTVRFDREEASAGQSITLNDCWIRMDPTAAQPRLTIDFRTDQFIDSPVRWEVIYGNGNLATRWSINTNNHLLPCWLFSSAWPSVLRLGEQCWFMGLISGEESKGASAVVVSSLQFLDVDPAKLVDAAQSPNANINPPPIRLAPKTTCTLLVKTAQLKDRRLESITLEVWCPQGQIAVRLLDAAKKWLHIDLPDPISGEYVDFSQLAFGIELRDGKMAIRGQVPDGLIARGADQRPLAFATAASDGLAPQCLAAWLADDGELQLPVSAASLEILSHLPLLR